MVSFVLFLAAALIALGTGLAVAAMIIMAAVVGLVLLGLFLCPIIFDSFCFFGLFDFRLLLIFFNRGIFLWCRLFALIPVLVAAAAGTLLLRRIRFLRNHGCASSV